jgi:hypothetical protein
MRQNEFTNLIARYMILLLLFARLKEFCMGTERGGNRMQRKIRSDIKVGNLEKKLGIGPGAFRNPDGRDTRSDKLLRTLRKEAEKKKKY